MGAIGRQTRMKSALALEYRVREAQRTEDVTIICAQQTIPIALIALTFDCGSGAVVIPLPDGIHFGNRFVLQNGVVVVVQVLADFGNLLHDWDVELPETIRGTHTREHEGLGAVDDASREDNLFCADCVHFAGQSVILRDTVSRLLCEAHFGGPGVMVQFEVRSGVGQIAKGVVGVGASGVGGADGFDALCDSNPIAGNKVDLGEVELRCKFVGKESVQCEQLTLTGNFQGPIAERSGVNGLLVIDRGFISPLCGCLE